MSSDETSIRNSIKKLINDIQDEINEFGNEERIYGNNKLKYVEFQIKINRVIQILETLITAIKSSDVFKEPSFTATLEELKRIIEIRMKMTAPKEMAKEKILHKMWRNNEKLKEQIITIKRHINDAQMQLAKMIYEKRLIIEEFQREIESQKKTSSMEIEERINTSNQSMTKICQESQISQESKKTELNRLRREYHRILMLNLKKEKQIREEKSQVQQQLKSWLSKYDTDIGERSAELDKLKRQQSVKSEELDIFNQEFIRQETEYKTLMREKILEEKRKQEEKLLLFMMNRSAITIQRAWRRVLAKKKKQKKKGKKGKK